MTQLSMKQYINELMNKYVVFFDVNKAEKIGNTPLAFSALYKRRDEKYFITKTIKVWGMENQQCVFAAEKEEPLTKAYIQQFEKDIRENVNEYVGQHQEHMSTIFLGVVITDQPVTEEFIKGVRKYRKVKFIKYGMHGWAELYLAIVDLKEGKVYVHRKGDTYVEPFLKSLVKKEEQL